MSVLVMTRANLAALLRPLWHLQELVIEECQNNMLTGATFQAIGNLSKLKACPVPAREGQTAHVDCLHMFRVVPPPDVKQQESDGICKD
jgi:hypothetical protein